MNCPDCGARVIELDDEKYCSDCALVVDDAPIDRGPEWREHSAEDRDRRRVGAPLTDTLHDRGLSTEISTDSRGLTSAQRRRAQRLRKWNRRSKSSGRNASLRDGLGEIQRIVASMDLDRVHRVRASELFRQAQREGFLSGEEIDSTAAACVLVAAREQQSPVTLADVVEISHCDELYPVYSRLQQTLGLAVRPPAPSMFVARAADAADLSVEISATATDLLEEYEDRGLHAGDSPLGTAAAAVYAAALMRDIKIAKRDLADLVGVSVTVIRRRYTDVLDANGYEDLENPGYRPGQTTIDGLS